jgi:hypothetical protein
MQRNPIIDSQKKRFAKKRNPIILVVVKPLLFFSPCY